MLCGKLVSPLEMLSLSSAKLAASEEGADIMPVEQQQERRRYFVRLGSLSEELRQFAYLRSTNKMKQVWQVMQKALAQLHCIIELVGRAQTLASRETHCWLGFNFIAVIKSCTVHQQICLDTLIFLCHRLKCLSKDLIKSFRRARRNYTRCGWNGVASLSKRVEMKVLQSLRYLPG